MAGRIKMLSAVAETFVGARLPAIASGLAIYLWLIYRIRGQARSYS
jgi:hypothetical protein